MVLVPPPSFTSPQSGGKKQIKKKLLSFPQTVLCSTQQAIAVNILVNGQVTTVNSSTLKTVQMWKTLTGRNWFLVSEFGEVGKVCVMPHLKNITTAFSLTSCSAIRYCVFGFEALLSKVIWWWNKLWFQIVLYSRTEGPHFCTLYIAT